MISTCHHLYQVENNKCGKIMVNKKVRQGSFLNFIKKKYNFSSALLYKRMGWERTRFYNHVSHHRELMRVDMWPLAEALGINIYDLFKEECSFYYGSKLYHKEYAERARAKALQAAPPLGTTERS